jgi:NADPH2:quinone reductase
MIIPLSDDIDLKKAANAWVNPLTALNQLEVAKRHGAKTCISLAATSQLCKQFYRLAVREGIEIINIVRRDEQIKLLQDELGAKYVLN